jgi:integrase/recombinase XerD
MNLRVNLTKRVRTAEGLRYCPVVESANGRIKPDWVAVDGQEEKRPEGAYYIEWREGGKRSRLSVGKDAAQAQARRLRKRTELNAVAKGVTVVPDSAESTEDGRPLAEAMATFLEETALTKKPKTLVAYRTALSYFAESRHKLSVEHIVRADMLKFPERQKGQAPRSVYKKFENVMSFLKWAGLRNVVRKGESIVETVFT